MYAAVIYDFNAPPRYATFADPVAGEQEQLVRVTAAGLHPIVRSLSKGAHYGSSGELPIVAGLDGVGRLQDGRRVYFGLARAPFGSMAELSLAPAAMTIPLPDGLDDAAAAGMANPAMSGWVALQTRAKFAAGESVLILGATGSAGQMAVQIARRQGAKRIIAAGRNRAVLESLTALGADATIQIDAPREEIIVQMREQYAAGIDVVLDYLWGDPAAMMLEAISAKGLTKAAARLRYVSIGSTAGAEIKLPSAVLRSTGLELLGSGFGSAALAQIHESITQFFAMAAQQPFQFNLRTAPLSDVEQQWNAPESGARLVFLP